MKVFYGFKTLRHFFPRAVVTIGAFDGVHLAHRAILRRIIRRARRLQGTSLLVTFDPHPLQVLRPDQPFLALTCIEHRIQILSSLGLGACVVIRFTRRFSRLSAKDFIKKVLIQKLRVKELWVGFDYVFGRNREGTLKLLREYGRRYGFRVQKISEVRLGGKSISSTHIRKLVTQGKLAEASRLLGRPYSLYGKVIRGRGVGKRLGYPTANIEPYHEAIPPGGVYGVQVRVRKKGSSREYWGLLNIGRRPTLGRKGSLSIEVHLLDFEGNLYGRKIEVLFLKRIRPEKKFPDENALIERIRRDERVVRNYSLVSSSSLNNSSRSKGSA